MSSTQLEARRPAQLGRPIAGAQTADGGRLPADVGLSVVIITCSRPRQLVTCLRSALANRIRPLEIVISDDAFSAESEAAVASVQVPRGVVVRHLRGPSRGSQAANAQAAIEAATHEALVFMHDDDFFLDGALDHLVEVWGTYGFGPDAVYGRQCFVDRGDRVSWRRTRHNDRYYRKTEAEGEQASGLWAALTGQFPNNGMLIRRSVALRAGYPSEGEVGRVPVDFHFALRYAAAGNGQFVLTHRYVAAYRYEGESISRPRRMGVRYDGHIGFEILQTIVPRNGAEEEAKRAALDRYAAAAVMGYLAAGQTDRASAVYRRHWRRLNKGWVTRALLGLLIVAGRGGVPLPIKGMQSHAI